MAKPRMTQTTPYDSPARETSFMLKNISEKFQQRHPNEGAKYRWGRIKSSIFDQCLIGILLLKLRYRMRLLLLRNK